MTGLQQEHHMQAISGRLDGGKDNITCRQSVGGLMAGKITSHTGNQWEATRQEISNSVYTCRAARVEGAQ
jgi:hypothetical protein